MKVGDYVRTSSGKIAKYLGHEEDKYKFDDYIYWYYEYYNKYVYDEDYEKWLEEEEVKVYKNLIGLIQVGDYVDKLRVVEKQEDYIVVETFDERILIHKDDTIKSIVTREMFESMEYKVKE